MMTRFIDVPTLSAIVKTVGVSEFLAQLTEIVKEDFKRWLDFDKSARLASHSAVGVIELMPASDSKLYSFKYVNGHPANTGNKMWVSKKRVSRKRKRIKEKLL